ncbi:16S rRNA (cytosine(967)-C(5))-methyltransferase RsmB [candidate division GN15 bacterium]|nr:16S rRNA (cytosine(967)-C(5))-methyltransferase RsmB [candidate division GN15 bacterium]
MAADTSRNTERRPTFDPIRALAIEAIEQIEEGQQTDDAIRTVTNGKQLRGLDHRFIQQLVNGTTKMRRRLDVEINAYLTKPASQLHPKVRQILRLGFYQLAFTDRVPAAAAVSESVNLARRFTDEKLARLVNAVMRARLREPEKVRFANKDSDPVTYLADYYSYPDYFARYCHKEFGLENAERLLAAYNQPPHITYRVNFIKAKPDEVTHVLQESEVEFSFGRYLPEFIHIHQGGLPLEDQLLSSGKVFIQDESSGMPVRLLNPKPGGNVVDLTAAPGGKATYAAIRMRNKGRVTAIDKSPDRLKLVVENAERLGIKIIAPVVCDMNEFKAGQFDRVLLDPPCSGWGTAGKNADLRWTKTEDDILNLSRIQTKMIDRAAKLVKPGGVLVYSTCTIIRDENDQIVEEFLLRNTDFEIDPADQFFDKSVVNERGFVKTYPVVEGLDGSFCARLKRKLNP